VGLMGKLLPSDDATAFECNDCGNEFSKAFRPEETPTCPGCGSFDLDEA